MQGPWVASNESRVVLNYVFISLLNLKDGCETCVVETESSLTAARCPSLFKLREHRAVPMSLFPLTQPTPTISPSQTHLPQLGIMSRSLVSCASACLCRTSASAQLSPHRLPQSPAWRSPTAFTDDVSSTAGYPAIKRNHALQMPRRPPSISLPSHHQESILAAANAYLMAAAVLFPPSPIVIRSTNFHHWQEGTIISRLLAQPFHGDGWAKGPDPASWMAAIGDGLCDADRVLRMEPLGIPMT